MQTNGTIIKDYSISMGRQKVCTVQSLSYFSEASKVGFFFVFKWAKGEKIFHPIYIVHISEKRTGKKNQAVLLVWGNWK